MKRPVLLLASMLAAALSNATRATDAVCAASATGVGVPIEQHASAVAGHPLTAIVVTQCGQLVVVYLTMPDGRLIRIDRTSRLPIGELLAVAYTATRSERVEVGCTTRGIIGYENHESV